VRVEQADDQGYHQTNFGSAAPSESRDLGFKVGGGYFHTQETGSFPDNGEQTCGQYVLKSHNYNKYKYYS
jgi:hypothetical protein